ncbi:MAG: polyprenyl synthetase family protein [Alphaproteobacteria bacterium]
MSPSPRDASPQFKEAMSDVAAAVNRTIESLLPQTDLPEMPLYDAMRHGVLAGGKRLRPFLAVHSAFLFNVDPDRARRTAAAIEFVHCYSLIHDDLPAMDDAALRRGQPTVHKKYGEAAGVLAGDALLTLAFEVLSDSATHEDPHVRCELIKCLAQAAGPRGMVGGQMLDLIGEIHEFDLGTISRMQRMKTGQLMAFACESGAILGKASEPYRRALRSYAYDLGLAFQVTDDILDVDADPQDTGKDAGKDSQAGKSTFVSTMGKSEAQGRAEMLVEQAIGHLAVFQGRADMLKELAHYVLRRRA